MMASASRGIQSGERLRLPKFKLDGALDSTRGTARLSTVWNRLFNVQFSNTINVVFSMPRELSPDKFEEAVHNTISLHKILGSRIEGTANSAKFTLNSAPEFKIINLSESELISSGYADSAESAMEQRLMEPFDFSEEPPIRVIIIKRIADDYRIGIVIHHAFSDLSSINVIIKDLAAAYDDIPLYPNAANGIPMQYLDYISAMDNWVHSDDSQNFARYWQEKLVGIEKAEFEKATAEKDHSKANFFSYTLDRATSDRIRAEAKRTGANVSDIFMAAVFWAERETFGPRNHVMKMTDSGRFSTRIFDVVGNVLNFVPLALDSRNIASFEEMVRTVSSLRKEGAMYSPYPYEAIYDQCEDKDALHYSCGFNFVPLRSTWQQLASAASTKSFITMMQDVRAVPYRGGAIQSEEKVMNSYLVFIKDLEEFSLTLGSLGIYSADSFNQFCKTILNSLNTIQD